MLEHYDIKAACRTGYAYGAACENSDSEENRREYAEEHLDAFFKFILNYDSSFLDDFIESQKGDYLNWLN